MSSPSAASFGNATGTLRASDYTSGFMSNVYPVRRVPDVSGLVGMLPRAMYVMLPIPEGCVIDVGNGGGTHPNGNETTTSDGWAAFSGTSAAAPQLAGVCALIGQTCGRLSQAAILDFLMATATDVTTGTNQPNFGNTAVVGPDAATGNGLVDAHRAVLIAKLRCRAVRPFRPPIRPIGPVVPVVPFRPPVVPIIPFRPPIVPLIPFRPPISNPLAPQPPIVGHDDGGVKEPEGMPLTDQDVAEIERFLIESSEPPEL